MNNQAAQTMPELPASRGYLSLYHSGGVAQVNGYTADQMHQYARDYAAALSQTSGVESLDGRVCGYTPGQSKVEIALEVGALPEWLELGWPVRVVNPAAPAASGGEDGWSLAMRVREALDRASCPDHFMRIAVETITGDAPQPPAAASVVGAHPDALPDGTLSKSTAKRVEALSSNPNPVTPGLSSESGASVSERAQDLLAAEFERAGMPFAAADCMCGEVSPTYVPALRALEQALTQQRGELTEDIEEVVTSLGDDAAQMLDENDEDERALNMQRAAEIIARLASTTPQPGAEALRWRAGAILGAAYRDAQNSDPSINFCTPEWRVALSAVEQALTESPGSEALRGGIRNIVSRIINDGRDREWVIRELESLLARGGK